MRQFWLKLCCDLLAERKLTAARASGWESASDTVKIEYGGWHIFSVITCVTFTSTQPFEFNSNEVIGKIIESGRQIDGAPSWIAPVRFYLASLGGIFSACFSKLRC
ncbi:hypothetical protein HEAR0394 [Herminiimonas arsenicoxydans]|uniref:Uncharacterized protein n=1 Tax=Herminiimonas arsenicoxydans TaxID=204773 RepID=A4G279_HERAR|nr:hypothetical protein HEAR0394 [Herminiimonas arsenicoxydans]